MSLDITNFQEVVVVPKNMAVVIEHVPNKKTAGKIEITYPQLKDLKEKEDEYDEEEQLYSAVTQQAKKYKTLEIPVVSSGSNLFVVVPHFYNPIVDTFVAREIAQFGAKAWVVLAPSMLNYRCTLCRLDVSSKFEHVPQLQPPHFITGIGAALVSALGQEEKLESAGVLVLNAEGHLGFEKVDADSIMDAAEVVCGAWVEDKQNYLKKLSLTVRKINSSATSGLYV